MNFPRRQFLGTSAVVLGSTLLDAITTPLYRWNKSRELRVGADSSSVHVGADVSSALAEGDVSKPLDSPIQFVDVAREAGLTTPNVWGGADRKRYIIEAKGSGIAFFDYDQDGWLDIYLTNGTRFNEKWPAGQAPTSRLYKNNRDGTFTDVTEKSGMAAPDGRRESASAITTTMAGTIFSAASGDTTFCFITTATAPSPMSRAKPAFSMSACAGAPAARL